MSRPFGQFTSSNIYKLCSNGRAKDSVGTSFSTYVQEIADEKILDRSLSLDTQSRQTSWGHFMERTAWDMMDLRYSYNDRRVTYLELNLSGVPDYLGENIVGDIKSPWNLQNALRLIECDTPEKLKKYSPQYYWQLVSNAVLFYLDYASLIVHIADENMAKRIMQMAIEDENIGAPLKYLKLENLPFVANGHRFAGLHESTWKVPQEDKDFLWDRLIIASEQIEDMLNLTT